MNTLFYSRKGGMGKTTLATCFALDSKSKLITFDYENGSRELYENLFPKGNYQEVAPSGKIVAKDEHSHVFDFGGYLDDRIIKIAKICDQCVIPVILNGKPSIKPYIDSIIELQKHNDNITLVINGSDKQNSDALETRLKKKFPKLPVFIIPDSKFVQKVSENKGSPLQYLSSGNCPILLRRHLKKLAPSFEKLNNYLIKEK